jgi:trans-aconitate methyltransferase
MLLNQNTLYQNRGNESVLHCISNSDRLILDVGCGAGDTGRLIKSRYPDTQVVGITCSQKEYEIAKQVLNQCIYANVEVDLFSELEPESFDVICFCHVLEHLLDPVAVIKKFLPYLKLGGNVIITLPNIANWRSRIKLVLGQFEYTDSGLMDRTHLRFYTFHTAPKYLI